MVSAELGPEHLAQVGQPHVSPIHGEDDVVLARRESGDAPLDAEGASAAVRRAGRRRRPAHRAAPSPRPPFCSSRPPRLMSPRPTKSTGKSSRSPKISEQDVDVLRRRDAAEQDDVALRTDLARERARASSRAAADTPRCRGARRRPQRRALPRRVTSVSGSRRPAFGVMMCTPRRGWLDGSGGAGEAARVGQLAAKVQAAHEREELAERRALRRTEPFGQSRSRARGERICCARRPAAVGGREQEDSPWRSSHES